jgi:hypothetical protein
MKSNCAGLYGQSSPTSSISNRQFGGTIRWLRRRNTDTQDFSLVLIGRVNRPYASASSQVHDAAARVIHLFLINGHAILVLPVGGVQATFNLYTAPYFGKYGREK